MELGVDADTLRAECPDLIHARVSAFDDHNPYSHLGDQHQPDESVVAAAIGRMMVFEGSRPEPGRYPVVKVVPTVRARQLWRAFLPNWCNAKTLV